MLCDFQMVCDAAHDDGDGDMMVIDESITTGLPSKLL